MLNDAVSAQTQHFGADHTSTLMSEFLLGQVMFRLNSNVEEEGITKMRKCLTVVRVKLGEGHVMALMFQYGLGEALYQISQFEEAYLLIGPNFIQHLELLAEQGHYSGAMMAKLRLVDIYFHRLAFPEMIHQARNLIKKGDIFRFSCLDDCYRCVYCCMGVYRQLTCIPVEMINHYCCGRKCISSTTMDWGVACVHVPVACGLCTVLPCCICCCLPVCVHCCVKKDIEVMEIVAPVAGVNVKFENPLFHIDISHWTD